MRKLAKQNESDYYHSQVRSRGISVQISILLNLRFFFVLLV
jgi:hypothetical protein